MTMDFQRARSPEQKQQRRGELVAAARRLALEHGVRAVTLTDIAVASGVHKSAVLRYFESREAVYLHLTAEAWDEWADACVAALGKRTDWDAAKLARLLASTLAARPLFCDLLAHAPLHLERGVSSEAVHDFKLVTVAAVDRLTRAIAKCLSPLTTRDARELVSMVSATTGSLWQISHPPQTLVDLYAEDPRLGHAAVTFVPMLRRHVETFALGLLSRRAR